MPKAKPLPSILWVTLGLAGLLSCTTHPQQEEAYLAAWDLQTLEGQKIEQVEAKATLINVWATWCKPCLTEMPSLEQAYLTLKDEGYQFIAASPEEPATIQKFAERKNIDLPLAKIHSSLEQLQIHALPFTIVLNAEGNKVYEHHGALAWDAPEQLDTLRTLLK